MATRSESAVLDLPRIYLIRMSVFLLVVAILVPASPARLHQCGGA